MYKFLLIALVFAFAGLSAPSVSSYSAAPALAGKAGGSKYRLPHKLKHEKDDKHADKTAKLA